MSSASTAAPHLPTKRRRAAQRVTAALVQPGVAALDLPPLPAPDAMVSAALGAAGAVPFTRPMPGSPGVYLLFYGGSHRLYRPAVDRGWPLYIGSCASLRERTRRHELTLDAVRDLDAADFLVLAVTTHSRGEAVHLEAELIDALVPVWNQAWLAGFGSKAQGAGRVSVQSASPWDCLHPGRGWATGAAQHTRRALASKLRLHFSQEVDSKLSPLPAPPRSGSPQRRMPKSNPRGSGTAAEPTRQRSKRGADRG